MEKPNVWQMIKEAIDNLNGIISYTDIRNYIHNKWPYAKQLIIKDEILMEMLLENTVKDISTQNDVSFIGDQPKRIVYKSGTVEEEILAEKQVEDVHKSDMEIKADEILKLNKQLKNNLHKLETANKDLEAFKVIISKDLRPPLNSIQDDTKILSKNYGHRLDDEGKGLMQGMILNANSMVQIIDDLLTFSKTKQKDLQKKEIDMTELAKSSLKELKNVLLPFKTNITILTLP
jgi:signal transduction histidine kinase